MDPNAHPPTGAAPEPTTTATGTIQAIVQDRDGSSDTWQLTETDRPSIKPNEVLAQVHAGGLDAEPGMR